MTRVFPRKTVCRILATAEPPRKEKPLLYKDFSDLGSPIDPRILLDPTAACFTSGPPKRRLRRSILEAFSNDPGNCARSKHLDSHNRRWIRAYRFLLYRPAAYDRSRVPSQPGIVSMWKLHTLHRRYSVGVQGIRRTMSRFLASCRKRGPTRRRRGA
ncbi:uncharacterized protein LOC128895363 isoform X2 [Hylaeus anthracinus]|uniref:uncharacterized protein LOC128895363 isoform X2 n=1 Tax=Hylaeus anthracinus TaxID=313031 RepID=UPI0023B96597|nr:uncharacterized protein LOC128895363 isoform X2 [Hylaeus anthracinus]